MGRYKAEAVIVKEVKRSGLKIIFYDERNIYVGDHQQGWFVFHRWGAPLGSYGRGWQQFRHLLFYEKKINLRHCFRLAFRWDIPSQRVSRPPDLTKFKIEERFFA